MSAGVEIPVHVCKVNSTLQYTQSRKKPEGLFGFKDIYIDVTWMTSGSNLDDIY